MTTATRRAGSRLSRWRRTGATSGPDGGGDGPVGGARRRWRLALAGAVAAIVLFGALVTWLVAFSPVLGVRTVDVRGTHTSALPRCVLPPRSPTAPRWSVLTPPRSRSASQALREVATAPGDRVLSVDRDHRGRGAGGASGWCARATVTCSSTAPAPSSAACPNDRPRLPLFVIAAGDGWPHDGECGGRCRRGAAGAVCAVASPPIQALDPDAITLLLNELPGGALGKCRAQRGQGARAARAAAPARHAIRRHAIRTSRSPAERASPAAQGSPPEVPANFSACRRRACAAFGTSGSNFGCSIPG